MVDPSTEVEMRGLVEHAPRDRPGDIFTGAAVPNREAAVDVSIVSPHAAHAGSDCVATAHRGKFTKYRLAVEEWGEQGTYLQPMIWSHEGRCHPDVTRVMAFASEAIARRSGQRSKTILRRWQADIGVLLAIRRARMARSLIPRPTQRAWYVQGGVVDATEARSAEGPMGAYIDGGDDDLEANLTDSAGAVEFEVEPEMEV